MARRLTRQEAVTEFDRLYTELKAIEAQNNTGKTFLDSREKITAIADRGALLIPYVPARANFADMWKYEDGGILPEDRGTAFPAFLRRLFHYRNASKRILDILRDDTLFSLHGIPEAKAPSGPGLSDVTVATQGQGHVNTTSKQEATARFEESEYEFMEAAIAEARNSRTEDNKTPLYVGAVVVKDGKIIARGHRGQHKHGEHAEYTLLERNLNVLGRPGAAANATLYCTLEPCIVRNPPKTPCAEWIKRHRIVRVVIGVVDPNRRIRGGGIKLLRQAGIDVALFPHALANEIEAMNSAFEREHQLDMDELDVPSPPKIIEPSPPAIIRGFHVPRTVPETFYEWRRWENPNSELEETDPVFDKAWLEIDMGNDRTVWDVCELNPSEAGDFLAMISERKNDVVKRKSRLRATRYYLVAAIKGSQPGDAERAAQTLASNSKSWAPLKLGFGLLVGWIAKHHYVGELVFGEI
jgi:pyrimidine deaminase RibD-like protein